MSYKAEFQAREDVANCDGRAAGYQKSVLIDEIRGCGLENQIEINVPMAKHTSFQIGGFADVLFMPESIDAIIRMTTLCRKNDIPFLTLGNGTNVLVSDAGFSGVVMKLSENLNEMKIEGNKIITGTGASLSEVAEFARENRLTGLEFAYGIPGTAGGAVYMNAGAYGFEMKDIVSRTVFLDEEGNIGIIDNRSHMFGYRSSCFQNNGQIILEVEFQLGYGEFEQIDAKMKENMRKREKSQPLDLPSAGSVFRRPEGKFVGPMIEACGLKGFTIGGAQISMKHAGFIVNCGGATAEDVIALIMHIKQKVNELFRVDLVVEIELIGKYPALIRNDLKS